MLLGAVTKQPAEIFPVSIDFAKELPTGDSFTGGGVVVTSRDMADGSSSTTDMVQGSPTVDGTKVYQKVKNGADGEHHRLTIKITTVQSNVFEHEIDLLAREV